MKIGASLFVAVIALLVAFGANSPANAQATRTWVSGVGDDANPCSRTAPCKTFAGAISKTAAGGEISVLDPGGYGTVTITKSISIFNDYSGEAGILAAGTNGITVNAAATDVVILRGLVIDGAPPASPGLNGIRFLAGSALYVQKCVIKNFKSASGTGIQFIPNSAAKLFVEDTVVINNTLNGVLIKPTGSGGVTVVLDRVFIATNATGFNADGTTSTGPMNVSLHNSVVTGSTSVGILAHSQAGGAGVVIVVDRSATIGNLGIAIKADSPGTTFVLSNSTVTGNNTGLNAINSGAILSFGNNSVAANATDGAPTGPLTPK